MSAKSIHSLFQGLRTESSALAARKVTLIAVLIASLSGSGLVLRGQSPQVFGGSPARDGSGTPVQLDARQVDGGLHGAEQQQERRYQAIAEFLAKRYRVSQEATFDLVSMAHAAGHRLGLDPLLIIAVMAIESSFNPIAESVAGAKGLMQVIPRYHPEKLEGFGGDKAVFDPKTNILVGSQILKEYLGRTENNLSMALQMYAGALNDGADAYSSRVLGEKLRLQQVVNRIQRPLPTQAAATQSHILQGSPLLR